MKRALLAATAALILPAFPAYAQPGESVIDSVLPGDEPAAEAPPAPTGDAVTDRFNALEARIRQLEARNKQLEEQATETQSRVQRVEVRAAKGVQPGVAPVFADVNDNFTFKPRGVLQVDYAGYNDHKGRYDYDSGTDIRRARFGFEGTFYKKFKWRLDAELIKQQVNLLDAYISYALNPKWTVTVGQQKAPYGLEANTSDVNNTFFERSLGSNAFGAVGAERRVGLLLSYNTDKLNAAVGVFGAGEGVTRNADTAAALTVATPPAVSPFKPGTHDEPWSINGRVTWDPIFDTGKIVHLGVSAYHVSNLAGNSVTVADRPGVRVDGGNLISAAITGTAATAAAAATGVKNADYVGAEAAVVYGRFSVQSEFGALALDQYGTAPTINYSGFNVFGSVFLTGESRSFKNGNVDKLKPFNDFNPSAGHWGAFEVAFRYDQLSLRDPDLATNQRGRFGYTYTGALNWYLNPNLRASFNYVRFFGRNSGLVAPTSTGTAQIGTAKGDIFASRLQLDF